MSRQAMDEHKEHLDRLAVHDDALVSPLLPADGRGSRAEAIAVSGRA
jgi:hypothetical protein